MEKIEVSIGGMVKHTDSFWQEGSIIDDRVSIVNIPTFSIRLKRGTLSKKGFKQGDLVKVTIEKTGNISDI